MRESVIRPRSAWAAHEIDRYLAETLIPVRLACVNTDGAPLICSLWYRHADDAIWCATQQSAHIVGLLVAESRCGFEIAGDAPPYRGVRGQGRASISAADGPEVLLALIDRYLGSRETPFARWLIARKADEVAIRSDLVWASAWDFAERMSG